MERAAYAAEAAEAAGRASRERTALTQEQRGCVNQMRGWLATEGEDAAGAQKAAAAWWTTVCDWAGASMPEAGAGVGGARRSRGWRELDGEDRRARRKNSRRRPRRRTTKRLRQLVRLKGIATISAAVLFDEGLVWRAYRNRRQIGGLLGFARRGYDSGESAREQGISRAGNARLQSIRHPAGLELGTLATDRERWRSGIKCEFWERQTRARIGIVAVARKLVIALWRYVNDRCGA